MLPRLCSPVNAVHPLGLLLQAERIGFTEIATNVAWSWPLPFEDFLASELGLESMASIWPAAKSAATNSWLRLPGAPGPAAAICAALATRSRQNETQLRLLVLAAMG